MRNFSTFIFWRARLRRALGPVCARLVHGSNPILSMRAARRSLALQKIMMTMGRGKQGPDRGTTGLRFIFPLLLFCSTVVLAAEPTVTRQESELLAEIADMARTNEAAAVARLQERIDRRSSAALDFTLGNLHMRVEDYEDAVRAYRAALEKEPAYTDAAHNLARALILLDRPEEAGAALRPFAARDDARTETLLLFGHALLNQRKWITAESVYRKAIVRDGETPEALLGLAQTLIQQDRLAESAALLEELVQREPDNITYWAYRADVLAAMDRRPEAVKTLETARRLNRIDARMLILLGDLYSRDGHTAPALRAYEAAAAREDAGPTLFLRAAEHLHRLGDPENSRRFLDRLDEIEPDALSDAEQLRALRLRADLAMEDGNLDEAAQTYESVLELDPLNAQAMLALGDLMRARGDPGSAELWYERAARIEARAAEAYLRLAQVALDRDDYGEAVRHVEQSLILSPDSAVERYLQQLRRLAELEER